MPTKTEQIITDFKYNKKWHSEDKLYLKFLAKKWYSEEEILKAIDKTMLDGLDPTYVNDLKKELGLKR